MNHDKFIKINYAQAIELWKDEGLRGPPAQIKQLYI